MYVGTVCLGILVPLIFNGMGDLLKYPQNWKKWFHGQKRKRYIHQHTHFWWLKLVFMRHTKFLPPRPQFEWKVHSLGDSPTALNGIGEFKPQGKKMPQQFNSPAAPWSMTVRTTILLHTLSTLSTITMTSWCPSPLRRILIIRNICPSPPHPPTPPEEYALTKGAHCSSNAF